MAKSRVVLAILGMVFLLLNPAGVCAGTPSSQGPTHPCCPAPAGSTHHSDSGSCVCIDRQPAAPVLPSLADDGMYAPAAVATVTHSVTRRSEKSNAPDRSILPAEERFLTFHQILV